jgi:BirA family biotin operon repressor/biotin-[acetyl-CoA-carboxylase] ligase
LNFFRHLITYFAAKNAILLDIQFIQAVGDGHVFFIPQCDSTQQEIQRFIAAGAMGLVAGGKPIALYTHFQYQGVGQRGSNWNSQPGMNALFTVAFPLDPKKEFDFVAVNKALSASVALAVGKLVGEKVDIKWPNDLLYRDVKLGGMLMETTQIGPKKYLLLGLGVNVNQTEFPQAVAATSLVQIASADLAQHFNIESVVMSNLLALLDAWHHTSFYVTQYDDLLYKRNETTVFLDVKTGVSFSAVLKEVNHLGQVCLELANGERVVYHHGQVRMNYVNASKN